MYFSIITFSLLLLQGVLASPVAEGPLPPLSPQPPAAAAAPQEDEAAASSSLGRRTPGFGDIPFPLFPKRNFGNNKMGSNKNKNTNDKSNCPTTTNTQTNACSGGNPYCCSSDGNGGHICSNTTACNQKIICCNNNNGFQICIGDINFNVPITINIYE